MSADDKEQLDIGIFSALMSHWERDDIDASKLASDFGVSQQKIAAMISSAQRSPRAYGELIAAGAHECQIPPWIVRTTPKPDTPPDKSIEPSVTPPGSTGNTEELPPPGTEVRESPGGNRLPPPSTVPSGFSVFNEPLPSLGPGYRLGAVYDNVREREARLQAMGIIRTEEGRYLQAAMRADGTPGFIEVDPGDIEQALSEDIGSKLSEAAVSELKVHMTTVLRKIGLNPTAFISYAWALSKRDFPGDLGDFCIQLTST